ncbi:protein unc-13 homolog [Physcomitrium patens]|uniref:MHD1 domain-containing protein n=1 Tax=Physcomitrium patens TaxID=3218 RepID=A0A2K1K276_PHYPA|nr:uncharacterized protein LOC112286592 [Physcomitrium patens]XP_024384354.1 uncharacterized protein LOC112286592 [Physcomitrium patens]PNR47872.1 hypothetical protein PHYPA_012345 [Physcomitrium patens]|eukprot:XP_024384353.1 uncharacterized protein LOC112286592 [Physcomitrella patens]
MAPSTQRVGNFEKQGENGKQEEAGPASDRLGSPIPPLRVELSGDDIRETAYEILVAVCGSSPISFRNTSIKFDAKPNINKSLTSSAASQMKRALGLHSSGGSGDMQRLSSFKSKKNPTITDVLRAQMRISEQSETRIRKALSRATAGQASKRNGLIIVPLELLQNIGPSAFADEKEYVSWLRRQLRVLEAGLLVHPLVPGDEGMDARRLKQALQDMVDGHRTVEKAKSNEIMQMLRSAAMGRATRAHNGQHGDFLHWADGYPLNAHIYVALLSACFDTLEEVEVIAEMEEVLEMIKKTWDVLGIDQTLHDTLFAWVLYRQFVVSGQSAVNLLQLSERQLDQVGKDVKGNLIADQVPLLKSVLSTMQFWAERRLLAYHDSFPGGASDIMAGLLAVAVGCAQILQEHVSREFKGRGREVVNVPLSRVDVYVRSSVRTAFAQLMETVDSRRKAFKGSGSLPPALAVLAQDTMVLAISEVDNFSPVLKRWHPYAGGVAAATLHSCYSREFKQYLSNMFGMTVDTVAILKAADELEKRLVGIAVEDAAECDDGGKSLIREMPPYEADQAMGELTRRWVEDNVEKTTEWIDRNVQQEKWSPAANKENYAPSAVEVLRIVEESLDTFFEMPAEQYPELLQELASGLDKALHHYIVQTVKSCGSKDAYIPPMPPLTRCKVSKSWLGSHKSKGKSEAYRNPRKSSIVSDTESLANTCVRINTIEHINTQLQSLEKKIRNGWMKEEPIPPKSGRIFGKKTPVPPPATERTVDISLTFQKTRSAIEEGVEQLIDLAAYRAVFADLRDIFLDGLYVGDASSARIPSVLEQLEVKLGEIAETSAERLRNRIAGALMRACFDCFLLILLAGGPTRAFKEEDADVIKDDMYALKELFLADGEGLPEAEVEQIVAPAAQVLTLFEISSSELIQIYLASITQGGKKSSKTASIPPTTGKWSATDANTVLRVLCYRCDESATKFLKKTYHLKKAAP